MARKGSKSSAPVLDTSELEDDDLELVEADEEPEAKPAKGKKGATKAAKAAPAKTTREATGMGAAWLAEHVNDTLGTDYTPAQIRVVLRRLAADGELEREVGTDRARYSFTGENDRTVKAVVKAIKAGAVSRAKAEGVAAAKATKAEAPAAKPAKAKATKAKAEEPPAKPARRKRA